MISPGCEQRGRQNRAEYLTMPSFNSRRLVNHSAPEMFDLVADVERYPEFVPLCSSLKVRQRTRRHDGTEIVVWDMTVSFKLGRAGFSTQGARAPAILKAIGA